MEKTIKSDYSSKIKKLDKTVKLICPNLPYHNYSHLTDVANSCEKYALLEGFNSKSIFILKTAALLHDIVYDPKRNDNEEKSVGLAEIILQDLNYSTKEIKEVSKLILATKLPTNPRNILEMIICDADIDNLGRDNFFEKNELVRLELGINKEEWYDKSINFLNQSKYYTKSAQQLRLPKLKENLQTLRGLKCQIANY